MLPKLLERHRTLTAALLLAAAATPWNSTDAQNFAEGLEGLNQMVLVVERLTEEGAQCNMDRRELADVMQSEIANTGLVLSQTGPTLYLIINTSRVSEICFSAVDMDVHYFAQVPHPTRAEGAIAEVTLWEDSLIASSELATHGDYIRDLIQDMTADFVDDWREANPRALLAIPDAQAPSDPAQPLQGIQQPADGSAADG